MNEFRLTVFICVARQLSFTKAAQELNISQPAISKHIAELEAGYGVQLIERTKHRVCLTPSGKIFLQRAQQILNQYKELEFEMNMLSQQHAGELSIGASTTISQYVLPRIISGFMSRFPDVKFSLFSGNSSQIQDMLANHQIDLGLVEGANHRADFHYSKFSDDELVLVSTAKNKTEQVNISELKKLPLVLRESGSGTLEIIAKELKKYGIVAADLNVIMQLGSSEAIKRYIIESNSYAIVSIAAVFDELKRGELRIIDIEGLSFKREFSFISQIGSQNKLSEKFINFATMITKSYNL